MYIVIYPSDRRKGRHDGTKPVCKHAQRPRERASSQARGEGRQEGGAPPGADVRSGKPLRFVRQLGA